VQIALIWNVGTATLQFADGVPNGGYGILGWMGFSHGT
jgi:hypothetical protein